MVVYRCETCAARLTRPVAELTDARLLRDSEMELIHSVAGEPDFVPEGFVIDTLLDERPNSQFDGWPVLNPHDSEGSLLESSTGCCGPSDYEEPNTVCENGHAVGFEHGDCYTTHYVALDPESVEGVVAPETVTGALDGEAPAAWRDVVRSGSTSDRRRAIVLLGIEGASDDVELLSDIATEGPSLLRQSAVRALGRIGDSDAVPALEAALSAAESSMRMIAARALGKIDGQRARVTLLDRLAVESDARVCWKIRSNITPDVPIQRVEQTLDRATRESAIDVLLWMLGVREDDESAALLEDVLTDDEFSTAVREDAAWKLSCFDDERDDVDRLLVDAIDDVEQPSVRAACIEELKHRDELDAETTIRLTGRLVEIRDDPDEPDPVRSAAEAYLDG